MTTKLQNNIAIKDLPLLNKEQEYSLGEKIQTSKNKNIKDEALIELVEHNLKLVLNEAIKYSKKAKLDVEELYNAGREGLIKAALNYNPIKFKNRFSTYATPWIKLGMRNSINQSLPVKVPAHIINQVYRKNKIVNSNIKLEEKELREQLNLTDLQFKKMSLAQITSVSLNEACINDQYKNIEKYLIDDKSPIPGSVKIKDPRVEFLYDAMQELDKMSLDIITAQIINVEKTKLKELGKKYGMSGERIRQLRIKALKTLKDKINKKMAKNKIYA